MTQDVIYWVGIDNLAFVHYCKTELGYSFDRQEWIADMSMDCDYDLTVSCVQLDLVDSPGADTEDQETEWCRLTPLLHLPPLRLHRAAGSAAGAHSTHTGACFIIYPFN